MSETFNPPGNEEKRDQVVDVRDVLTDITSVGKEKPLGCLSFSHISEFGETSEHLIANSLSRGLEYVVVQIDHENYAPDPVLYVYDKVALQELLDQRKQLLEEVNWPIETKAFVDHLAKNNAPQETALFDLVADAFADYTNPGRLTYPKPLTKRQWIGITFAKMFMKPQTLRNQKEFYHRLHEKKSLKTD